MPKHTADELQRFSIEDYLRRKGLPHLRVRRYGVQLIVESGPTDDPVRHVRFHRRSSQVWTLDIASHTGAWEPTAFSGKIEHLADQLVADFPWTLEPVE